MGGASVRHGSGIHTTTERERRKVLGRSNGEEESFAVGMRLCWLGPWRGREREREGKK